MSDQHLESLEAHEIAKAIGCGYDEGSEAERGWYLRAYAGLEKAFQSGQLASKKEIGRLRSAMERILKGPLDDKQFVEDATEILEGRYVQTVDYLDWVEEICKDALKEPK